MTYPIGINDDLRLDAALHEAQGRYTLTTSIAAFVEGAQWAAQQAAQPVEKAAPSDAQSALDQIELMLGGCTAIEVVRAALSAQQAAQPVAGEPAGRLHADGYFTWRRRDGYVLDRRLPCDFYLTPAAPAPVALVPMTDEQVSDLYARWYGTPGTSYADLIRAVEAHHGIKAGKDGAA